MYHEIYANMGHGQYTLNKHKDIYVRTVIKGADLDNILAPDSLPIKLIDDLHFEGWETIVYIRAKLDPLNRAVRNMLQGIWEMDWHDGGDDLDYVPSGLQFGLQVLQGIDKVNNNKECEKWFKKKYKQWSEFWLSKGKGGNAGLPLLHDPDEDSIVKVCKYVEAQFTI